MSRSLISGAIFVIYLVVSCNKRNYNNPLDPHSDNYVGDVLSADSNGNGIANALDPEMVLVKGGCFSMGSDSLDEGPVKKACVDDFHIGVTEVTQGQFTTVFPNKLTEYDGAQIPMGNVSWFEAVEYCNKLSDFHNLQRVYKTARGEYNGNLTNNGFRLPTEAEWEYALAADSGRAYSWGANDSMAISIAQEHVWYSENSLFKPNRVGEKGANRMGLFDQIGNVMEWTHDWYSEYMPGENNPTGPEFGVQKVLRGGSFLDELGDLRVQKRFKIRPDILRSNIGLRVVRK